MGFFNTTAKQKVMRRGGPNQYGVGGDQFGARSIGQATADFVRAEQERGPDMPEDAQVALKKSGQQRQTGLRRQSEREARRQTTRKGATGGAQVFHEMGMQEMVMRAQIKEAQDQQLAIINYRSSEAMKLAQMDLHAQDVFSRAEGLGQIIEVQSEDSPSGMSAISSILGL